MDTLKITRNGITVEMDLAENAPLAAARQLAEKIAKAMEDRSRERAWLRRLHVGERIVRMGSPADITNDPEKRRS